MTPDCESRPLTMCSTLLRPYEYRLYKPHTARNAVATCAGPARGNLSARGSFNTLQHVCHASLRRRPWKSMPMGPNVHIAGSRKAWQSEVRKPSRGKSRSSSRTIIRWTGEDPERDGLIETPARVTRSFEEFFSGYGQDLVEISRRSE